ncbi:RNA polymerase sigma factor [Arthrobacter russicus]|uniref:RNA polymerase sigma-70 factor (ECF subfamily) n=1 Tax=Arthrobacter russicus TaxID=172040 RepID=A0ABU1JGL2_9MICC|nr:RNA polymerase sigma-70 factor (ECF subfamily) [Arthrobacter russicus]
MDRSDLNATLARVHHEEWARVVAALTRRFRDLDIAEEATAEAFATAVEHWPADGVPANPGAWLTTANRKAIDRLRRENKRDGKQQEALVLLDESPARSSAIDDDRLRLIFTCAHPALSIEARVALTLRLVGGLTMPEIARAFLVPENTMGRRITRAKTKIAVAGIPYRVPSAADLPARTSGVLAVLYLIFNEGYLATGASPQPVRSELTAEAIRLSRLLHTLLPDDGEVAGLLALMLLIEARSASRTSAAGDLVPLDEQDRGLWNPAQIAEGHQLLRQRLAAINAVHTSAGSPGNWTAITPSTASAPICCVGGAATPSPGRHTAKPSSWPEIVPKQHICGAAYNSSSNRRNPDHREKRTAAQPTTPSYGDFPCENSKSSNTSRSTV